jgi:cation diffusion facilitator CzcD-associated flavoprotein CzcO
MFPHNSTVAVIGAGPVGLAAAAHLITRNIPVKIYEAADTIAANVAFSHRGLSISTRQPKQS